LKSTRTRRAVTDYGPVHWWSDAEQSVLDPPTLRSPAYADGSGRAKGPTTVAQQERQTTVSENHPQWRKRRKGVLSGDIGGDFFTERYWVEHNSPGVLVWGRKWNGFNWVRDYRYGPVLAAPTSQTWVTFPPAPYSDIDSLDEWGATAVARCKPTNSSADLLVFLGEIFQEGIPKLIGSALWKQKSRDAMFQFRSDRLKRAKGWTEAGSSEFLNYQFGWAPMVNEISSIAHTITHADSVIRQFQRDSGKVVRRRYEFPPEVTESTEVVQNNTLVYLPVRSSSVYLKSTGGTGRVIRHRKTVTRRWFSGAFTYYMPGSGNTLDAMYGQALLAKKLLGLSLDPDTIWNLAPWSWAVDWFSNTGDVISNLTDWSMYSLCLRYGYIMEHVSATDTYSYVGPTGLQNSSYRPGPLIFHHEVKQRRRANPFGFGLTWDGLSTIQWAILGALGINRSSK
jgi:hypothetical protein